MSTLDETNEANEAQENDVEQTEPEAEEVKVDEATASDSVTTDEEPKPKKKKGLGFKILIAVIAVVVVLGAGGGGGYLAFHDQPWFCNFVCHTPMDPYVASYEDGTSINPLQADSGAVLSVTLHKDSDQNLNCLECHVPTMSEQITEGIHWVTGSYELPIEMKLVAGEPKADSGNKNGEEFCLRPGCHTDINNFDDLKASTADQKRNPHDSHLGKQDCSQCHQTHEQSTMYCTQCHADAVVPDGWLTYQDQQKQIKEAA
jgi:flagellar basal body-associated protein FliL